MWHGFPHPHFREQLIDINTKGKPSSRNSWYLLRISRHPEISGPSDGSDDFDSESQAHKINPNEAMEWFKRVGFDVPPDLLRLVERKRRVKRAGAASESREPDASDPFMPASWFKHKYGISPERLRAAWRRDDLRAERRGKRIRYSVRSAMQLWPEDEIALPGSAAKRG